MSNLGLYTLTTTAIAISSSGDNTVVTPSTGKALRIVKLILVATGAVTVKIVQGTSGEGQADKSGAMAFAANTPYAVDLGDWPMPFVADKSLVLNLGSAVAVNGFVITYED